MNEFSLIQKYLQPLSKRDKGAMLLKDDIYYDKKKGTIISVDTYSEGIHFINSKDPNKFLKKILRASLSDLYCKGIKPKSYFLSFSLKNKLVSKSWLKKIKKILNQEQIKFNITLVGGDTIKSSSLVITIVTLGYAKNKPVLRNGCKPFDEIYVTGNIGDSYIGLNILKKKLNFGKYNSFFIKKYYEPELQTKISPYLHKFASSSIDISDGLAQDLNHLCFNSNCGALIDLNLIPLSRYCKKLLIKNKISVKNIFSQGDDYQILFTSNRKNSSFIFSLCKKMKVKISKIGVIKKEKKIIFKDHNSTHEINSIKMGYKHIFK